MERSTGRRLDDRLALRRTALVPAIMALSLAACLGMSKDASPAASGKARGEPQASAQTALETAETVDAALPPLAADTSNSIGMNVWFLSDWDGSYAFADAMEHARPWQDAEDWHKPVRGIDERGWPTADASTVIGTGSAEALNGTYRLSFTGQADVSLLWAPGSVSNKRYDPATNRTTAEVTFRLASDGNIGLVLKNSKRTPSSKPGSGFSDMKLWRPGYPEDGSQVFTKPFLEALKGYKAIRTMDWSVTNQNLVVRWKDRMRPGDMARPGPAYRGPGGGEWNRSELGVAIEHQVRLCNDLDADLWINVPVAADDEFVRKLALALRYGTDGSEPYQAPTAAPVWAPLERGRKVYVEYANEVWNSAGGFECFRVVEDIVRSLPDSHPLLDPPEENVWYLMWRWPAYRIAAISDAFRAVWGDAAMMETVRPVLMTQRGNGQESLSQALNWLDARGRKLKEPRPVSSWIWGAGGSAYYAVNKVPRNHADLDAFFARGNWPDAAAVADMAMDAVWAGAWGLKRVAYEGGPSLDAFNEANGRRANADPRMTDLIMATHDAWSATGGDLLVYYCIRGPHQWEFTPDIGRLETPKLDALRSLMARPRAPVSAGASLPGTIVAVDQPGRRVRSGTDYLQRVEGQDCVGGNDAGEWIALAAHAASAGRGSLSVKGAAASGAQVAVWVNGARVGEVHLPRGEGLSESGTIGVDLPAGLVVIKLEVLKGSFHLRSVAVK